MNWPTLLDSIALAMLYAAAAEEAESTRLIQPPPPRAWNGMFGKTEVVPHA